MQLLSGKSFRRNKTQRLRNCLAVDTWNPNQLKKAPISIAVNHLANSHLNRTPENNVTAVRTLTFTYFQVNGILDIFDELLAPPSLLIDKPLEMKDKDWRELLKCHSSTDLHLVVKQKVS